MKRRFWQWVYWRIVALDDYACYRIGQASRWVYNNHLQTEEEKAERRTFLELFNRPGPVTCRPMRIPFTMVHSPEDKQEVESSYEAIWRPVQTKPIDDFAGLPKVYPVSLDTIMDTKQKDSRK